MEKERTEKSEIAVPIKGIEKADEKSIGSKLLEGIKEIGISGLFEATEREKALVGDHMTAEKIKEYKKSVIMKFLDDLSKKERSGISVLYEENLFLIFQFLVDPALPIKLKVGRDVQDKRGRWVKTYEVSDVKDALKNPLKYSWVGGGIISPEDYKDHQYEAQKASSPDILEKSMYDIKKIQFDLILQEASKKIRTTTQYKDLSENYIKNTIFGKFFLESFKRNLPEESSSFENLIEQAPPFPGFFEWIENLKKELDDFISSNLFNQRIPSEEMEKKLTERFEIDKRVKETQKILMKFTHEITFPEYYMEEDRAKD